MIRGDPLWIGCYYYNGAILWQGYCGDMYSSASYSNWDGKKVVDASKQCAMVDPGTDLVWKQEKCKQEYRVLCEENLGTYVICYPFNTFHKMRKSLV